ncbi:MAG: hypothetical protein IIZ66_06335 [Clostridia bacterium]|nr:hypothetical protein [Clostridia bacterium]
MENFSSYFLPERRIFLENISYEALGANAAREKGKRLDCKDSVVAQLRYPFGVKIVFNRRLTFQPEELFELSVSFAAELKFDPEKRDLVDWKSVNVAHEFQTGFPILFASLNARCTLLIAEITSAAGASPVIPLPAKNKMTQTEYGG